MRKTILAGVSLMLAVSQMQAQTPAKAPPPRPTVYKVWAGDLNGDGKSEILTWDNKSKLLVIKDASNKQLSSHPTEHDPRNLRIADIDGDGIGELIIAEGLAGYNTQGGAQTDIQLKIYQPLETNSWDATELFRAASERPEVTSLDVVNVDADADPELLFSYMISKYQAVVAVADRVGDAWKVENRGQIRMGMHVDAGDIMNDGVARIVVGRPYGDPQEIGSTSAIGDAFVLQDGKRLPLPVYRGVSSVAVGNVSGDAAADVVVADGWHMDYGKVARARLAVLHHQGSDWKYEMVEDIPQSIRIEDMELADLDHDGADEIVVWAASRVPMLEGIVRLYHNSPDGWKGVTLADSVQGFAIGDFNGDGTQQIVFAGPDTRIASLALGSQKWDAKLAEAIETIKVDPKSMIGKPAPEIRGDEWIGGEKTSLEELRGKVVLIDFWATWCGPCIAAFPTMKRWLTDFGPQGFAIIGMTNHSNQTSQDVREFLAKRPLPWVVPIDTTNRTHLAYGTGNLPHQVLIDRQGVVYAFYNGSGETLAKVEADIKELLNRK